MKRYIGISLCKYQNHQDYWPIIHDKLENRFTTITHRFQDFSHKDRCAYCKVEFNQPSCWLYSMPNLLVFQHLVTLYLGGIIIRVVSEIECWNAQECARKQRLVIWSRGWLTASSRQMQHTCQACQKLKRPASWSTTGQNRSTGHSVIARLDLATQSSRESKPRATPVLKNLTFHILFSPQYKYPLYPQKNESF